MSYFFTAAFFALISVFSFSTQAMTPDETQPLLGKTRMYYYLTEENDPNSDYLLKIINDNNPPTYWILSNASKTLAYLQNTDQSKLETIDANDATPELQEHLIKKESTLTTFLSIKPHQDLNLSKSLDLHSSTEIEPAERLSVEDGIAYSLNTLLAETVKNKNSSSPINYPFKNDTWLEHLKRACCLEMLARVFGHSDASKPPSNYINEFYDGT